MPHRLSKSRYTAGLQCHKLLWWKVHEPLALELQPDEVLEDRFDQGRQVGAAGAQPLFGRRANRSTASRQQTPTLLSALKHILATAPDQQSAVMDAKRVVSTVTARSRRA